MVTTGEVPKKDLTLASSIPHLRTLSDAQKRFVVAYAGGRNLTDSYLFAKPDRTRDQAAKNGHKWLKNPAILYSISELKSFKDKKVDLSKDAMASRLMMLIGQIQSGPLTAKHYDVVVKIMDMFNKMNGNYVQNDVQVNIPSVTITLQQAPPRVIDIHDATIISEEEKIELPSPPLRNLESFLSDEPDPQ